MCSSGKRAPRGKRPRVLLVCAAGERRSPTAAALLARTAKAEVKAAGAERWASRPVTRAMLEWADVVVCMEETQRELLEAALGRRPGLRWVVLGIPDEYARNEAHLVMQIRLALRREGII